MLEIRNPESNKKVFGPLSFSQPGWGDELEVKLPYRRGPNGLNNFASTAKTF